mmetsp:Transcript_112313/g.322882  ORF Transcript_112313/g.322882 Transcript_112313/m.322882 type:complete len:368 (-) Transcript_112313:81-1184(-)
MPRGPGKKENYNFDYSRFSGVDKEDATVGDDSDAPALPAEILRELPGELQEAFRLMHIAKQTGDVRAQERANELALKAVERGGPEMKQCFQQEVMRQAATKPEAKRALEAVLNSQEPRPTHSPPTADDLAANVDRMNDLSTTISKLHDEMKAGQELAAKKLEAMKAQQERLEKLQGPEDFAKFMAEQGFTPEDLQRCFSGDEAHAKQIMERAIGRIEESDETKVAKDTKKLDHMLEAVDKIHRQLNDLPDSEPPPVAKEQPPAVPSKPAAKKAEAAPEAKIPEHRVQYQKDANGRLQSVELRCELPGVAAFADIELDVSDKYLRLRTLSPAYVVNVGPFPSLVDAPAARAKFSKKRQELMLSVPAKP